MLHLQHTLTLLARTVLGESDRRISPSTGPIHRPGLSEMSSYTKYLFRCRIQRGYGLKKTTTHHDFKKYTEIIIAEDIYISSKYCEQTCCLAIVRREGRIWNLNTILYLSPYPSSPTSPKDREGGGRHTLLCFVKLIRNGLFSKDAPQPERFFRKRKTGFQNTRFHKVFHEYREIICLKCLKNLNIKLASQLQEFDPQK